MLVLAWDTSAPEAAVGLVESDGSGRGGRLLKKTVLRGPAGHSAALPPAVSELCDSPEALGAKPDLLACGRGPGSFTGLRVGLALAKGLGLGLDVPAVGVHSLLAMALAEFSRTGGAARLVAPVVDARHGEVFSVLYRFPPAKTAGRQNPDNQENRQDLKNSGDPEPEALTGTLAAAPGRLGGTLAEASRGGAVTLVGPGLPLLPPGLWPGFLPGPVDPASPEALADLAAYYLACGTLASHPPAPLYGRSPDIFKKWAPPARLPARA
ncbi:MAG: tRNA (adenosine(37)-N6)-threonylcarbamoyltransferase complex dimerization subunit type 1 TsaB [Deltaproteobacteria bacterium]|nr:tRNA (adenosine(37)-N6)-threonylcarbamoyltransferase complex dimerization subunit type 1 TsaB [Deltaproteobacteria bacterium]